MGLVSIGNDGATNVCGHCGFEFFVNFQDMTINSAWVTFPECPSCKVATDNYVAVSSDDIPDDIDENSRKRNVACHTLYKRALSKAKKQKGVDPGKFPASSKQIEWAEADDVIVEPPLHSSIKDLRDKRRSKDGK